MTAASERRHMHSRGLILIGLFKLSKALVAIGTGIFALHLIHQNLGDLTMRLIDMLPIDPMGSIANRMMDRADLIDNHQLRQFGTLSFCLAVVYLIEGSGLMARKVWAEYLTVVLTAAAMPWEMYELVDKPTPVKAMLLAANAAVVVYLWVLLRNKRRRDAAQALEAHA